MKPRPLRLAAPREARCAATFCGCVLAVAVLALAGASARAAEVPFLTGRVVDTAEILRPTTHDQLTAELKAHEQSTGNQIAVLTVPTIDGEPIEDYAARAFASWKLGQRGKDNGVLVVVVPRERKMRIEVGYGLEPTLTDVTSGRIIRDVMAPAFKAGDYDRGVTEGVRAVIAQLEGRGVVPSEPSPSGSGRNRLPHFDAPDLPWRTRILAGAFIFGIIGIFTIIGVVTPGVGWFLYLFLIPFWAMFPIVIVGVGGALWLLGIYLVGYPLAKILIARTAWHRKVVADMKTKGTSSVGGFVIGSSGSSGGFSSGGGGSGGGGFSGGGGSSGGGGASGSW